MTGLFHRQLAEYATYHRDERNCLMHVIGNPVLFVAAVLPLSLLSVTILGIQTNVAALLVIPALMLWIAWDLSLGLAIVATSIPATPPTPLAAQPLEAAFYLRNSMVFQTSDAIRYDFLPPIDRGLLGRTTGLYLALAASDNVGRLQPHFDSVELIATIWRTWNGDPIEPYRVYELKGCRGGVPY
jgi:Protein of unknown function (DUF962)